MKLLTAGLISAALLVMVCSSEDRFEFDPNGYVIFCLCMGRFGNQAEHFLGSMSFAKGLNRTLVIPPFITYKNIPFKEWFRLDKLNEFHRSISAEDFMEHVAPKHWPEGKRFGFCWLPSYADQQVCQMKNGNPSTNFWNELGVAKFDKSIVYDFSFYEYDRWKNEFPSSKYPVIALKGAPATFPMLREHRDNQKYLVWSEKIKSQLDEYIGKTFGKNKFIGIHLRNGPDWENACNHLDRAEFDFYMASPQCLEDSGRKVSRSICLPCEQRILIDLEKVLAEYNNTIRHIYVATDKNPMIKEIKAHFKDKIKDLVVVHHDPWLPIMDVGVLARSEHFIGNCVSSFTSFVKRERDVNKRPSSFWAFDS